MKRTIRNRRLTPEEAAKYNALREQIEREKPEITMRIRQRIASLRKWTEPSQKAKLAPPGCRLLNPSPHEWHDVATPGQDELLSRGQAERGEFSGMLTLPRTQNTPQRHGPGGRPRVGLASSRSVPQWDCPLRMVGMLRRPPH